MKIEISEGIFISISKTDYLKVKSFSKQNIQLIKRNDTSYPIITHIKEGVRVTKMVSHIVMDVTDNDTVIHKDKNHLNLMRSNLRKVSKSKAAYTKEKKRNTTSKYKGVSFAKSRDKWRASIKKEGSKSPTHLGYFDNEDDAAIAYNAAARLYHGELATINIIK